MTVIALAGVKGGVGKTAAAVNLAVLAARAGAPALLWDLDPQGAAGFCLAQDATLRRKPARLLSGRTRLTAEAVATPYAGLDLVPSRLGMRRLERLLGPADRKRAGIRRALRGARRAYRWVVLDCASGAGRLTEHVLRAADLVLAPVVPSPLAIRGYQELLVLADKTGAERERIVPFFSMVEDRKRLHRQAMAELRLRDTQFLTTAIPYRADIERMGETRKPIVAHRPSSEGTAAYHALWNECRRLTTA